MTILMFMPYWGVFDTACHPATVQALAGGYNIYDITYRNKVFYTRGITLACMFRDFYVYLLSNLAIESQAPFPNSNEPLVLGRAPFE